MASDDSKQAEYLSLVKEVEHLNGLKASLQETISSTKKKIVLLEKENSNITRELTDSREECARHDSRHAEIAKVLEDLKAKFVSQRDELSRLADQRRALQRKLEEDSFQLLRDLEAQEVKRSEVEKKVASLHAMLEVETAWNAKFIQEKTRLAEEIKRLQAIVSKDQNNVDRMTTVLEDDMGYVFDLSSPAIALIERTNTISASGAPPAALQAVQGVTSATARTAEEKRAILNSAAFSRPSHSTLPAPTPNQIE